MNKLMMISTDGHVNPRPEDYADLLEAKYRDRVGDLIEETRIFLENTWLVAADEKDRGVVDPNQETGAECKEGLWNPHRRLEHLQREGFVADILFPGDPASIGLYFMNTSEPFPPEYRAAGVRAYNRFLADYCSAAPDRLFGIAQTEPWPDMQACIKEIELAKRNGMIAVAPPRYAGIEAAQPPFTDPCWEPFWAACAANDLVVSFHIGHLHPQGGLLQAMVDLNTRETGFTDLGQYGSIHYDPGRRPFWQMMLAGVFDRYPNLRVTFSELRVEWIAPTLAQLEQRYEAMRFSDAAAIRPKLRPTEYWFRNCAVSHMFNPYDISLRQQVGVSSMMLSADYPHMEGLFPNSREWLRLAFEGVSESDARQILGENAARIYKLDTAPLQLYVEKYGLDPREILGKHEVPKVYSDSFGFRSIFLSRAYKYDAAQIDGIIDEDQNAVLQLATQ